MSNNNTTARSGCGPRLVWLAKAVFTVLLVVGVIVGILWGGFMIYEMVQTEIDRSANSVATRFGAQESRIDVLRREVDDLVLASPGQAERIRQLEQALATANSQIQALDVDLRQQDALLEALAADMAVTLSNDETAAGSLTTLGEGLAALQGDFNEASLRLDKFGGEVDTLTGEVTAFGETAVSAQEQAALAETAVSDMGHTLMIFRAWELIARARLRLLENNLGLAQADVAEADEMLQFLIVALPEEAAESAAMQTVQTRLALAADNLILAPAIAAADLETAWDVLDKILMARLLAGEELAVEIEVETETAVPVEAAQTSTPESTPIIPAVTPTPETAPTLAPMETPTPTS